MQDITRENLDEGWCRQDTLVVEAVPLVTFVSDTESIDERIVWVVVMTVVVCVVLIVVLIQSK